MVTVSQRPIGVKIIDQIVSAVISDSSGDALVTLSGHSLITGNYVYLESDVDQYNGMWYVTVINGSTFKLSDNTDAPFVEYYVDADVEYYQTNTHVWSSIFLPIIYKATNDLWPVNTDDIVVTVTGQVDDNGYTQLQVTGVTGAGPLEYVILSDGTSHQVVEVDTGVITINLVYDASNSWTTVQKYYNNYQVRVKIFAGLPVSEPWAARKPWQEVATLSLTPDSDNNVMFSVAEYIRALVNVRNNPILYSMPLNLDAFTGFYVSTAEAYDESDGYSITTEESSFVADTFEGFAVTSVLPFKNRYSGHLSEYIYISGQPAQWLNTLTTVIGIVDKYFDISFIKNISGPFTLIIDKWANDYRYETELVEYEDFGIGVYRLPLEFSSIYDQYCIRIQKPEIAARAAVNLVRLFMENCADGVWTEPNPPTLNYPEVTLASLADSGYVARDFTSNQGVDHPFTYEITIDSGSATTTVVHVALMDEDCNILAHDSNTHFTGGVITGSVTLNPSVDGTKLGIRIQNLTIPDTRTFGITDLDFGGTPGVPALDIVDELCIDIYEVCGFDDGAVIQPTSARRLLEDGGFRLLED